MISFCNLNNPYLGPLHRRRPIFLYCLIQRKYRWKSWLSPQLGNLERPDCSKLHHDWWAQVGSNLVNSHVSPGNLSNFTSWWCTKSLIRLRGWLAVENLVDIWSTSSTEEKPHPRWSSLHLFSHCPDKIYIDMEGGTSLPFVHNDCWSWGDTQSFPWVFSRDHLGLGYLDQRICSHFEIPSFKVMILKQRMVSF